MSEDTYPAIRDLIIEYADAGLSNGEIYEKLEANSPELLDRYVADQRRPLLIQAIWTIVGQSNRQRRRQATFADTLDRAEAGESLFLTSLPDSAGSRKTLAEMTRADMLYSADLDESKANGLMAHAALKRSIAKKLTRGRTVGEVFSAEQIANFMHRLEEAA